MQASVDGRKETKRGQAGMLALTEGDVSEREIEKRKPTRRNQDQPSERGNEETVNMALRRQSGIERGQVKCPERR